MTEGIEALRLVEGLDANTSPDMVWKVAITRHMIDIDNQRMSAYTLLKSMTLITNGGSYIDAVGHLYSKAEIGEAERKREEELAKASEMRRLVMFRNIAKRFDK